jgi:multidrug efflux pump subunit AcrA (membrane-fusion protein)
MLFCALGVAALALAGCGRGGGQEGYGNRVPDVGVVTMAYRDAVLTTDLPGRTSPYQQADVRPQVNGILKARLFEEGGTVRAGQPLYQIDPAPYQAAFDSAKAALANAQANLATTRAKAERYASLLKQSAIAPQDYDDAEAAYKQAAANVLQQSANLESAKINLGYTRITAPVTGRIGRSLVTVGALVTADQTAPLATIPPLEAIGIYALSQYGHDPVAFVLLTGLVFFAWGEVYSLFPATCRDTYGGRHAAANAGLLYTAKGTASLLVPLASMLTARTGGWFVVFIMASVMNAIAAVVALVVL